MKKFWEKFWSFVFGPKNRQFAPFRRKTRIFLKKSLRHFLKFIELYPVGVYLFKVNNVKYVQS